MVTRGISPTATTVSEVASNEKLIIGICRDAPDMTATRKRLLTFLSHWMAFPVGSNGADQEFENRKQHKHQAGGKIALMHSSSRLAAMQNVMRQRHQRTSCGTSEAVGKRSHEILAAATSEIINSHSLADEPSVHTASGWVRPRAKQRRYLLRCDRDRTRLIDRASLEASNAKHQGSTTSRRGYFISANTASRDMPETRQP